MPPRGRSCSTIGGTPRCDRRSRRTEVARDQVLRWLAGSSTRSIPRRRRPDSAATQGFQPGDVLVSVGGGAPARYAHARPSIDRHGPGSDDLDALMLVENGQPGYQAARRAEWLGATWTSSSLGPPRVGAHRDAGQQTRSADHGRRPADPAARGGAPRHPRSGGEPGLRVARGGTGRETTSRRSTSTPCRTTTATRTGVPTTSTSRR